jgi:Bacterial membrane protein YfhO
MEPPEPSDARSSQRVRGGVVAAFAALALFLFHGVVFGGRQFYFRDLALQWHPQAEAFVHAVTSGAWPLWNPFASFGQQLLANPNTEIFYPFTWLLLLLPAWTYYTCYVLFHFVLAGVGMFALGRHLGLSRTAALAAAMIWVTSGPFLSLGDLWSHLAAASWLPWVVRAADRALARPSAGRALWWGAGICLMVVLGSLETALMAVATTAFLALRFVSAWRRRPQALGSAAAHALLAGVFAVALSAAQWIPSWEVARRSDRADLPAQARAYWSVSPPRLLQVAWPAFPDRLFLKDGARARWSEGREPYLGSLYFGCAVLALVGAGLLAGRPRAVVLLLVTLAALSTLLALGRHASLYGWAAALVPPLRMLRFPEKAMVLAAFCVALAAGFGCDGWRARLAPPAAWTALALLVLAGGMAGLGAGIDVALHPDAWGSAFLLHGRRSFADVLAPTSQALIVAGALGVVAGVLALVTRSSQRSSSRLATATAVLAVADLVVAHHDLNRTAPAGALSDTPAVLAASEPRPYQRTFVFDYFRAGSASRLLGHEAPYVPTVSEEDWEGLWQAPRGLRAYGFAPLFALWGREESYSLDPLGLYSRDVATLNQVFERTEGSPELQLRFLRMAAVDSVVALHRAGFERLQHVATLPSPFIEPIQVFRVPGTLPRAYVVGSARVAPPGQGWKALLAPDFDPAREVILPEAPVLASGGNPGWCRIVSMRADRMVVDATLAAPAYLVTVDAYDPGWRVTVGGRRATLLRANVAFRAVEVPAGTHRVEFLYRPASVRTGLAISALAAAAALAWSVRRWRIGRMSLPAVAQ